MALDPEQIAQLRQSAGLSAIPPAAKGINSDDILSKRRASLGITNEPKSTSVVGDLTKSIPEIIKTRGAAVEGNISGTSPESQGEGSVVRGVQAVGNAFGGVTDIAGSLASSLFHHLVPKSIQENMSQQGGPTPVTEMFGRAYDELGLRLDEFAKQHPDAAKTLESLLKAGQSGGEIAGGILTAEGAKQGLEKAVPAIKNAPETLINKGDELKTAIESKIMGTPEAQATEKAGAELQKINEMITPKSTIKEAKLATDQGRLYKGKERTLFKSGGEDMIAASDQQADSVRTIYKNIPGAAEMDESALYQALDEKVGDVAKDLKPQMQATLIKPETVQKITDDWEAVKVTQRADEYLPDNVNIKKLQNAFEERLKNSGNATMDDLWETRKAYDASVPTRIKQANDMSSEVLQAQKDIWLQNRRVLTDAINDAENGMGEVSRRAFKEMRDMYEAKTGLLSKAKIETTVKPSKAGEFFKNTTTGKVTKHLIKGAVGAGVGKVLGGTPGEIAGGVIGAGL